MNEPTAAARRFGLPRAGVVVALSAALTLSACSRPLDFADWAIPVPEGATVHEYPGVTDQERAGQRIEIVEDLVIGERGDDRNYLFGPSLPWIEVDAEGNVFVLDSMSARVQVFDPSGEFLRTMGSAGQGPGEFGRAQQFAVAGDTLVVGDTANMRFSRWSLAGQHLGDSTIVPPRGFITLAGNPDGTLMARYVARPESPDARREAVIVHVDADGHEMIEIARALWPSGMVYPPDPGAGRRVGFSIATRQPDFALDPGRTVYFGSFEEYQVLAFELDGNLRWALRVAQPRLPVSDGQIETRMRIIHNFSPEATASELDWPEINYAIDELRVDGHGHLYVFPFVDDSRRRDRPVDVYSSDGERLFTGVVESPSMDLLWQVALDDHIYGVGRSDDGEWQVLRHRLVEPF